MRKAIIYYSHGQIEPVLGQFCRNQLKQVADGIPIFSVTHDPIKLGTNLCVGHIPHTHISIYKQIIRGVCESGADLIYLAEHDILYPHGYFNNEPTDENVFCYLLNSWHLTPRGFLPFNLAVLSMLIAYRVVLVAALAERISFMENLGGIEQGVNNSEPGMFEPYGNHRWKVETKESCSPIVDIRHGMNFTGMRGVDTPKSEFVQAIPYWGLLCDVKKLLSKAGRNM